MINREMLNEYMVTAKLNQLNSFQEAVEILFNQCVDFEYLVTIAAKRGEGYVRLHSPMDSILKYAKTSKDFDIIHEALLLKFKEKYPDLKFYSDQNEYFYAQWID